MDPGRAAEVILAVSIFFLTAWTKEGDGRLERPFHTQELERHELWEAPTALCSDWLSLSASVSSSYRLATTFHPRQIPVPTSPVLPGWGGLPGMGWVLKGFARLASHHHRILPH